MGDSGTGRALASPAAWVGSSGGRGCQPVSQPGVSRRRFHRPRPAESQPWSLQSAPPLTACSEWPLPSVTPLTLAAALRGASQYPTSGDPFRVTSDYCKFCPPPKLSRRATTLCPGPLPRVSRRPIRVSPRGLHPDPGHCASWITITSSTCMQLEHVFLLVSVTRPFGSTSGGVHSVPSSPALARPASLPLSAVKPPSNDYGALNMPTLVQFAPESSDVSLSNLPTPRWCLEAGADRPRPFISCPSGICRLRRKGKVRNPRDWGLHATRLVQKPPAPVPTLSSGLLWLP